MTTAAAPRETMEMVARSSVWTFDPSLAHVGFTKSNELRLFINGVQNGTVPPLKIPIESIRARVTYPRAAEAMGADELRRIMHENRQGVEVVVYLPTRKIYRMGTVVPEACKVSIDGKSCVVATRCDGWRKATSRFSEPEDCPLHMCYARGRAIEEDHPDYVRWMREYDDAMTAAENEAPVNNASGGSARASKKGVHERDQRALAIKTGRKWARTWRSGRPLFPPVDDEEAGEEEALVARVNAGQEEYHAARFLPTGIKRRLVDLLDEIGAHERNRAARVYEEILEENTELRRRLHRQASPSSA